MTKQRINQVVGSIGAFIGIIVFIAYIPQIFANLQGNKAQPFQPLSAAVSCLIWVIYGWTQEPKKDWILIIPNSAGVILGGLTFLTALYEYNYYKKQPHRAVAFLLFSRSKRLLLTLILVVLSHLL